MDWADNFVMNENVDNVECLCIVLGNCFPRFNSNLYKLMNYLHLHTTLFRYHYNVICNSVIRLHIVLVDSAINSVFHRITLPLVDIVLLGNDMIMVCPKGII